MDNGLPQPESGHSEVEISQLFGDYLNQHGYAYQTAIEQKFEQRGGLENMRERLDIHNGLKIGTEL